MKVYSENSSDKNIEKVWNLGHEQVMTYWLFHNILENERNYILNFLQNLSLL